ncbi:hypothetical protein L7F22_000334 [Adiantum nelumboides]|nr:hypothetical protein [Adiantum nelumboides]
MAKICDMLYFCSRFLTTCRFFNSATAGFRGHAACMVLQLCIVICSRQRCQSPLTPGMKLWLKKQDFLLLLGWLSNRCAMILIEALIAAACWLPYYVKEFSKVNSMLVCIREELSVFCLVLLPSIQWNCYFESIASIVFDMDIEMNDSSANLKKTKEDDGCGSSSLIKDAAGILSKSLSPKPNHFKSSPSASLKRALCIARGRKLIKDESKVELDTQHPNAQLALSSASNKVSILLISELFKSISFRFAFEGKVLCKYGTYKITNNSYPKFLKAGLLDKEGTHTITFVVADPYIPQLVESFQVKDFLHIEEIYVKQRDQKNGGTSTLALHANATTLIVKGEPFECRLTLYPEHKIADLFGSKLSFENPVTIGLVVVKVDNFVKIDGESAYRLVIADGPNSSDKAMVFGSLEIVNINSVGLEFICGLCKGNCVSRQPSNPYCFSCEKTTEISKVPCLQCKLTGQDGSPTFVTLRGKIVDQVPQLS